MRSVQHKANKLGSKSAFALGPRNPHGKASEVQDVSQEGRRKLHRGGKLKPRLAKDANCGRVNLMDNADWHILCCGTSKYAL
jgi:hypothetical protein